VGQKSVISIHISVWTGIVPEIEQIERAEINQDKRSPALRAGSHFIDKRCLSADRRRVRAVYKWRYGFRQTEWLNFIKRVK
jgi:hypothetical protein